MEIEKKEAADMNDAPPSDPKNCLYNCSECSSNIEIISLDENNIEFICNNKHNIKIEIKEYLNKMKQYNKIKLNDDKCDVHKKEYLSYCFDCNNHLCKDCLKSGEHKYHYKINIKKLIHIFNEWKYGDWGLGIGDWGLGPIPNPQSPIPILPW